MRIGGRLREKCNVAKIIIPTLYNKILWLYLSFKKGKNSRQEQAPAVRIKKLQTPVLQRCLENRKNIILFKRCPCGIKSLVFGNVMCHFFKP